MRVARYSCRRAQEVKSVVEKLKKPKQPNNEKACKWCKEEIKQGASICANCQQPQKKRHWFLAHPSLLVSSLSFVISGYSLWVTMTPAPASPRVGMHHLDFGSKTFSFAAFNYGDAPTFIMAIKMKASLLQGGTTHEAYSYYDLDEPVFLPVGASPEKLTIGYATQDHKEWKWKARDEQDAFNLSFLYGAASLGSNLDCEITLWYSDSGFGTNRNSSTSRSNGSCASAMAWMSQDFGPLKDRPTSDADNTDSL